MKRRSHPYSLNLHRFEMPAYLMVPRHSGIKGPASSWSSLVILMASDQCAVGADGKLLPAAQINFFNDPDDMVPISGPDGE